MGLIYTPTKDLGNLGKFDHVATPPFHVKSTRKSAYRARKQSWLYHGSSEAILRRALAALGGSSDVEIAAVSRFFRTPCFPPGAGPDFVNAAAMIVTHFTPPDVLLEELHRVEAELGRERFNRWEARVVDLDLLAMGGEQILPDTATLTHWIDLPLERQTKEAPDQLILPPHPPRIQDRGGFVLVPLADIAPPEWRHPPKLGRSVDEMLAELPKGEIDEIVPL